MKKLPDHLGSNARAWRAQKRAELDGVLKAVKAYSRGSMYTPNYEEFRAIRESLRRLRESLKGNWVEW